MAETREAAAPEKRSYKKLHHMEHEPVKGEHGGMMVTHHYHSDGMAMKAPEVHMFAKEDGDAYLEHVKKHASHMQYGEASKEEHAGPETKVEAASEPAGVDVNA